MTDVLPGKITVDEWLEALESGKYKQGHGQLYNDANDSYCCLGVGCHLAGLPVTDGIFSKIFPDGEFLSDLPAAMQRPDHNIHVDYEDYKLVRVTHLNDGFGRIIRKCTFPEIAKAIRASLARVAREPELKP